MKEKTEKTPKTTTTKALISQSAYAKRRGCTPQYINKMIKKGTLTLIDGKIDPEKADAQLHAAAHPGHNAKNGTGDKPKNYYTALTEHTEYKAALARLDYEQKCGRLISAEQLELEAARVGKAVRDSLLNIPKRLAGELAGETDQHRIMVILTDEIHRALEALNGSGSIRRSREKTRVA